MPVRLVDGEALWRSDKINQVEPSKYRAEYANLIPLALADGTFEAGPKRVWADVYAYNRPDISITDVENILNEFARVGLLTRRLAHDGKVWGFWVGIEKRLPSESTRDRYKNGKSNIFNEQQNIMTTSRQDHDDIVPSKDLDRYKIGISRESNFKIIKSQWWSFFHKDLSGSKQNKQQYSEACSTWGEDIILKYLESWAAENQWVSEHPKGGNRLYVFLQALPGMIQGDQDRTAREKPEGLDMSAIEFQIQNQVQKEKQEIEDFIKKEQAADEKASLVTVEDLFGG